MRLCDPPLADNYSEVWNKSSMPHGLDQQYQDLCYVAECELPVIDLRGLRSFEEEERQACMKAIAEASAEWGFFQVLNHGISSELLQEMRSEQIKLFDLSFEKKLLNDSYRWGNPTATAPRQFSWSEAFHFLLARISEEARDDHGPDFKCLRYVRTLLYIQHLFTLLSSDPANQVFDRHQVGYVWCC